MLPPAVEVITDEGEPLNPWRGYRACLTDIPDEGHVAVLQDDVLVCTNFMEACERIAQANQNTVVSLFLSRSGVVRRTVNMASLRWGKTRYVDNHPQDLVHVVGVLWPVARARSFLAWVDANPLRIRGSSFSICDDAILTRWMKLTGERVRVTVPSLVQHPDDVPSIVNSSKMRNGADHGRTAAYWIGDADPLELDWSS
jgi:hypothetical protein